MTTNEWKALIAAFEDIIPGALECSRSLVVDEYAGSIVRELMDLLFTQPTDLKAAAESAIRDVLVTRAFSACVRWAKCNPERARSYFTSEAAWLSALASNDPKEFCDPYEIWVRETLNRCVALIHDALEARYPSKTSLEGLMHAHMIFERNKQERRGQDATVSLQKLNDTLNPKPDDT